MSLQEKIKEAMVQAMKAKNELRLSTIRMMRSALKNVEIEKRSDLTDAEIFAVLQKLVKQRQDSIEQYEKGGRQDLADKEKAELVVIREFLPTSVSEVEILKIIDATALELKAESIKDMGKLIKAVMAKIQGPVDGRLVSELVKKKLG